MTTSHFKARLRKSNKSSAFVRFNPPNDTNNYYAILYSSLTCQLIKYATFKIPTISALFQNQWKAFSRIDFLKNSYTHKDQIKCLCTPTNVWPLGIFDQACLTSEELIFNKIDAKA